MQYNKVEVYGVNTAKLKVLTEAERQMLLQKIKHETSAEKKKMREEVISGNLELVLSVTQHFTSQEEDLDDLFQVGCVRLARAIDNFSLDLDVRLSIYGVPMTIGEIQRYLRDNSSVHVSRSMRDTTYKAMQIEERMTAENGKESTANEITKALGLQREEVVLVLEAIVEPISLYEPVFSDGNDAIYVMDQVGDKNDDSSWLDEIALKEATSNLNDREERVPPMCFFQGKIRMEVAGEIGTSQAQVSWSEKGALDKIKKGV